ncbi:Protein kinase-like domain [Cordyceps javanica]|uniref:Protein kinase-like domain n=1 Tax=Cordyceps javanica TaxID=43265 RepID=A0A545V0X6_9HYPO|nr:Protein kinase-like domain [Cordyceps javanica]TQW02512.1 Protein kinase-like domain [Cordyceps javanica]
MSPPTNQELNDKREEHCFAITPERASTIESATPWSSAACGRPSGSSTTATCTCQCLISSVSSTKVECLRFLRANTNLPLPKLHACFEDDGAAYLITEYVDGVGMNELSAPEREIVAEELNVHMQTLRQLKPSTWGGPGGKVLPPWRRLEKSNRRPWRLRDFEENDLVFCHNDLSAYNVILDPNTLEIRAIIDWEYGGFYPPQFEQKFFKRVGPSAAVDGEVDDTEQLTQLLAKYKM